MKNYYIPLIFLQLPLCCSYANASGSVPGSSIFLHFIKATVSNPSLPQRVDGLSDIITDSIVHIVSPSWCAPVLVKTFFSVVFKKFLTISDTTACTSSSKAQM